jgi:flavin-dependent dehydrogenase
VYGQCQELLLDHFGQLPPAEVRCRPEFIHAENVLEWRADGSLVKYPWELPKNGRPFTEKWINVWRDRFDFWLLRASGADYWQMAPFAGCRVDENLITVTVNLPGGVTRKVSCDWLVGADGAASSVRREIDPDGIREAKFCVANYSYYEYFDTGTLEEAHWYTFFQLEFGDIIACVHHKDDFLALSVGGFKGTDLKKCEANFVRYLHEMCGVAFGQRRRATGCALKLAQPCLGKGKVLLAGDAAGLIYLNGEGMSAAIDS